VTVGTTNPPQPPTSCEAERQVNDPFDTRLKEGEGKEGVGSRKKGGKEEKGGGEKEVEAAGRQGPGRHPPPNTLAGTPRTCQTTPCNWVTTCHTRMDKMSTPPHSVATNPNTTTHITRNPNVTSHDIGNRSNDRFDLPARVPKEGGRWEKRGGGVEGRKEGL